MIEKWWVCLKCIWVPRNRDDQSTICPKCGNECVQKDFLDKSDMSAWVEDLKRNNVPYV